MSYTLRPVESQACWISHKCLWFLPWLLSHFYLLVTLVWSVSWGAQVWLSGRVRSARSDSPCCIPYGMCTSLWVGWAECIIMYYLHLCTWYVWTILDMYPYGIPRQDLVGGLEHYLFFHVLGISSSQLTHIVQRGRSTTNQIYKIWDPSETWFSVFFPRKNHIHVAVFS